MAINNTSSINFHGTNSNDIFILSLDAFFNNQILTLLSPDTSREAKNSAEKRLRAFSLAPEKEAELYALSKSVQDQELKEWAKNRLLQAAIPNLYHLACKFHSKFQNMEERELFNCGFVVLDQAFKKFDPKKANGASFSTFAFNFMRHNIVKECIKFSSPVPMTLSQLKRLRKFMVTKKTFEQQHGRTPTVNELKELLPDYSPKYIKVHMNGGLFNNCLSLDDLVDPDDSSNSITLEETLPDTREDILKNVSDKELCNLMRDNLQRLDKKIQYVLTYQFGLNGFPRLRLEDIGNNLNITTQKAFRLKEEGLDQLRLLMRINNL